jgi:hypothetical protein
MLLLSACNPSRDLNVDVSDVGIKSVDIKRYGKAIFELDPASLTMEDIKPLHMEYPFFVDADIDTTEVMALRGFLNDPVNQELSQAVQEKFSDVSSLEGQLEDMFRHFKYYFPAFRQPRVYTYISSMNFERPVLYADTVLVVGLDMYLGRDQEMYDMAGIPRYMSRWFVRERIVPEICHTMIAGKVQQKQDPSLLDYMVEQGKILYLMDAIMPDVEKKYKIRYTDAQLEWMKEYEIFVWGLIVEEQLLFSKERPKIKNFIDDGPFTSTISREAPPRIAEWLGWQMVTKYMNENKEVTMRDLLQETNSMKVLKKSKYKPAQKARS